MRVLWVNNIAIPVIAKDMKIKHDYHGGWLTGYFDEIKKYNNIKLGICFPYKNTKKIIKGNIEKVDYYAFPKRFKNQTKIDKKLDTDIEKILIDFQPDILHVFGTEFPYSYQFVKKFNNSSKTIVNIQGLVSEIAAVYTSGIPQKFIKKNTLRDILRQDNIIKQQKKYEKRGDYECKAIKATDNVIGRTLWDEICCKEINKKLNYFFCNEILRNEFYCAKWNQNEIEKYSIFVSQSDYPIKGFHYMLEAMKIVKNEYPSAHLYTTGKNILKMSCKDNLRINSYQKLIQKLIQDFKLENSITFLENLSASEIKERYLHSNVFVSPSILENSSNSIGEAMMLGVPTIASDVGGISSMVENGFDGIMYQFHSPKMLAYHICELFSNTKKQRLFSKNSIEKMENIYNRKNNAERLFSIYDLIKNI